jgi:predicted MFS family arabinose efflux permease
VLATVSAIGYGCAALVVPPATRWLDKRTVITLLLTASALVVAVLGESFDEIAYLAFGFFIYLTLQGVAICVVTVLQEEVDDAYRGRLFAFYDVIFNVSLAAGALLSAVFLPLNGRSPMVVGAVAAGYLLAAAGYWVFSRQSSPVSSGGSGTSRPTSSAQRSSS